MNAKTSDRPSSAEVLNREASRAVGGRLEVPAAIVGCDDAEVNAAVGIIAVQTCPRRPSPVAEAVSCKHCGCPLDVGSGDEKVEILVQPGLASDKCIDSPATVDPHGDVCLVHRGHDVNDIG